LDEADRWRRVVRRTGRKVGVDFRGLRSLEGCDRLEAVDSVEEGGLRVVEPEEASFQREFLLAEVALGRQALV
jgi:hypothetical protein